MMAIKMKPLARVCALGLGFIALANISNVMAAPHAPAGSSIANQVTLTFKDAHGKSYEVKSNIIHITIREIYTAKFTPISGMNQEVPADGGTYAYGVIKLHNTGNKTDTYNLSAVNDTINDSIDADEVLIYIDSNGNGQLDAAEMTPVTSIDLDADENASLIVAIKLPASVSTSDTLKVGLDVTSANGASIDKTITQISLTFSEATTVTTPVYRWEQQDGGNCHAYTSIPLPGNADAWTEAKTLAEASVYGGIHGHLASLNSFNEIEFIKGVIDRSANHWIGAHWDGTNWTWDTGEPSYINADGSTQVTFPQFVWSTNGWSAGEEYAYIWNQNNDGKWATGDNIWSDDTNGNPIRALVEFDIDCPAPEVDLTFTAAKDLTCDGVPDSAFDAVDLTDMAPDECAVMHVRAKNISAIQAVDIKLTQDVPNYLSYIPNSISVCGRDDDCDLVSVTDAQADNDNGYYDSANNVVVIGGQPTNLAPGDIIHGQYRIKID